MRPMRNLTAWRCAGSGSARRRVARSNGRALVHRPAVERPVCHSEGTVAIAATSINATCTAMLVQANPPLALNAAPRRPRLAHPSPLERAMEAIRDALRIVPLVLALGAATLGAATLGAAPAAADTV